jgi:hypothetical protein
MGSLPWKPESDAAKIVSPNCKFAKSNHFVATKESNVDFPLIYSLVPAFKFQIGTAGDGYLYTYSASAILGFLIHIAKAWRSDRITLKTAKDVFSAVLQDFIPKIKLSDRNENDKRWSTPNPSFVDSKQIVQLLRQCVSLDLGPQVRQLFDKLERLGDEEPAIIFGAFILPLSKELNEMSADQNPGKLAQEFHNMACLFTEKLPSLYASRCVGPKPSPPMDWRRTKCGCGCEECLQLDSFLDDPAQNVMQIQASSKSRLRHLEGQLPLIYQGRYEGSKPEHQTDIIPTPSGFELFIFKTKLAWATSLKLWEQDRDAARKAFDRVFDGNKDIRENLEKALENLGG